MPGGENSVYQQCAKMEFFCMKKVAAGGCANADCFCELEEIQTEKAVGSLLLFLELQCAHADNKSE